VLERGRIDRGDDVAAAAPVAAVGGGVKLLDGRMRVDAGTG
jgi:hypothetical protein